MLRRARHAGLHRQTVRARCLTPQRVGNACAARRFLLHVVAIGPKLCRTAVGCTVRTGRCAGGFRAPCQQSSIGLCRSPGRLLRGKQPGQTPAKAMASLAESARPSFPRPVSVANPPRTHHGWVRPCASRRWRRRYAVRPQWHAPRRKDRRCSDCPPGAMTSVSVWLAKHSRGKHGAALRGFR